MGTVHTGYHRLLRTMENIANRRIHRGMTVMTNPIRVAKVATELVKSVPQNQSCAHGRN
jgi:hypothetical protein